jgi:hypothetical protein
MSAREISWIRRVYVRNTGDISETKGFSRKHGRYFGNGRFNVGKSQKRRVYVGTWEISQKRWVYVGLSWKDYFNLDRYGMEYQRNILGFVGSMN